MTTPDPTLDGSQSLVSTGYRVTVDGGRDSFFAVCLEEPDRDGAWIMSDTVEALEEMR